MIEYDYRLYVGGRMVRKLSGKVDSVQVALSRLEHFDGLCPTVPKWWQFWRESVVIHVEYWPVEVSA